MTVNDVIKKVRVLLAADEAVVAQFADATLVDGTVVYAEGEIEVGATLLIKTEEGEESPYAPEGIHETADGMLITVGPNGEVIGIEEAGEEVAAEEVVEEAMEEVVVEAPVSEEALPATEELLAGIAEMIAPFTEEIAALTEEVTELKAKFSKLADEPAAKPIRNTFSETKVAKEDALAKRMEALRAIRKN